MRSGAPRCLEDSPPHTLYCTWSFATSAHSRLMLCSNCCLASGVKGWSGEFKALNDLQRAAWKVMNTLPPMPALGDFFAMSSPMTPGDTRTVLLPGSRPPSDSCSTTKFRTKRRAEEVWKELPGPELEVMSWRISLCMRSDL